MKFKLLLILIFCSTAVSAQIQSQRGSISFKSGEILDGTVSYFYDNPTEIVLNTNEGRKLYTPEEIQEINLLNGEKFVGRDYKVNQVTTSLILQALIESPKISLYRREDGATLYFYVSKDGVLYRLENNEVIIKQGRRTYKKEDNKYVSTLSMLMADRADLLEKLNKARLKESDLTKVIVDYNKGNVSYYWKSDSETIKEPNWVVFTQYSQYGTFLNQPTIKHSFGQLVGAQYYFSKESRHSVKLALERSKYNLEKEEMTVQGLSLRYEYAVKKAEKYNLYLAMQLIDIMHFTTVYENKHESAKSFMMVLPRISPGFGFEVKPLPKVALYAEVNHLLALSKVPKSFSFGLKYDFGKTSW